MVGRVETASVHAWEQQVGAVSWDDEARVATFEFTPQWLDRGLDLAPLKMPLAEALKGRTRFQFRGLPEAAFMGLPGLLADSLPDRFGHRLIDAWLARRGRTPDSFSPVERLCYIGGRGMGALEFAPALRGPMNESVAVDIEQLVGLAQSVLAERAAVGGDFGERPDDTLLNIIRVGTSAGGARPKAVIAWNRETGQVRSGQVDAPAGFEHWLLKFDGVADLSLGDPEGYGRIEFAYHLMAVAAGIGMTECRLLEENGRAHFMTRRFDRLDEGGHQGRLHQQSLCALAHLDFNDAGAHSYEQAFQVMRRLRLSYPEAEQMFRRLVFNVAARNQDDHTKNIAFLMDRSGQWRLAPAFDVTYAFNPAGRWTNLHQMSLNGKREDFTGEDFLAVGREMSIRRPGRIVEEVAATVAAWPGFAARAGVPDEQARAIGATHRLVF